MSSVCAVGLAVADLVLGADRLPTGPGKHFARSGRLVGGGPAANAAVTVARLGGSARFVGRVGDDPLGSLIIGDLADEGVDTDGVETVADVGSPVSAVLVTADGDRTIINHTDARLFDAPPDRLPAADAYLADVRWPTGAEAAMAAARDRGVAGVLDLDRTDGRLPETAITTASHVVAAIDALGTEEPERALAELADRTAAWVAVTVGADGVLWLEAGEIRRLTPPAVDVVDTLGAGDVFHGAFALALAEGREAAAAARFATAAAAIKCTRPGGRAGIPTRGDVDELEARTWP